MNLLDILAKQNKVIAQVVLYMQKQANYADTLKNFSVDSEECKGARLQMFEARNDLAAMLEEVLPGVCQLCLRGKELVFFEGKWSHKIDDHNYEPCTGTEQFREACTATTGEQIDMMFDGLRDSFGKE